MGRKADAGPASRLRRKWPAPSISGSRRRSARAVGWHQRRGAQDDLTLTLKDDLDAGENGRQIADQVKEALGDDASKGRPPG